MGRGEQGIIDAGFRLRWQGPDVLIVIGFLVVIVSVIGSFVALGGHMGALYQPFELTLIFGAAFGAFLAGNSKKSLMLVKNCLLYTSRCV